MSGYGSEWVKSIKGPREELPFSMDEYNERLKNVRRVMEERGIDVLLVDEVCDIVYLTASAYSFYLPAQLILPKEEEKGLTLIVPDVDLGVVTDATWVEDVRTWTMAKDFDYVFPPYTKAVLEEKGLDEKVIGYQMRSGQMTPLIYQNFREILPKAKFVDASYIILDFSYVKSPKEVEYMKKAAKIAEEACKAGMDAIKEGVTERDLAFAISKKQFELGAAYRSKFCLASGPNTASLHHSPVNRKLRNGDLVTMEPWGNYLYYQAHILRTGVLGSPPQKARDLHRVAKEAIEAGMKAMKPGVPMEEIEKITMEVAAEYGYEKYRCHRAGYNMGLKFLGLSRMEMNAYSLRKGDKKELKTGMIFALEPNFADLENRIGILLGNDVLVTENGGKALYDMPLDLIEK